MSFHRLAMKDSDVTLFLLEQVSVLFSAKNQSLYGLDAAATAELLAGDLEGAEGAAARVLGPLLERTSTDGRGYDTERQRLPAVSVAARPSDTPVYRLLGTRFLLRSGFAATAAWRSLLAPLADTTPGPVDIVVDAEPCPAGWQLRFNGVALDEPVPEARLFPVLQGRLRVLAYQGTDFLLAIHGAVLERRGRGLLLPGCSGAGKSTLALALLARGYRLLSDELAVIDRVSHQALPVPTAAAVKEGGRPWLAPLYPELEDAAEFIRWDGQRVRYVGVTPQLFAAAPCPIDGIVFPRFAAGSELVCRRLEPIEALREITVAGYQINEGLDVDKAETLLRWLLRIPAFSLQYGTTEQALEGLSRCVR